MSRTREPGAATSSPGKRTLVEHAEGAPLERPPTEEQAIARGRTTMPAPSHGDRLQALFGRRDASPTSACPTCKPGAQPCATCAGRGAIAGNDPVKATPLTDADRAVDLASAQLGGDPALQRAFDDNPPIMYGHSGPEIAKVQQALIDAGFSLPQSTHNGATPPDGVFGPETLQVIKGFQTRQGIEVDGVLGRQTLGELDARMTGNHVPGTPASQVATSVSATEVRPQQFLACGGFDWAVDWTTDGRNGYLVQEITAAVAGASCDGTPDSGLAPVTPHFWEAWRVQIDGSVHGGSPHDTFSTGINAADHTGTWSITGKVHWVSQLDPSFRFMAVPESNLLSTTTQPTNLGPVLLTRQVGGRWDCCEGRNTHVPITESLPEAPAAMPDGASGLLDAVGLSDGAAGVPDGADRAAELAGDVLGNAFAGFGG